MAIGAANIPVGKVMISKLPVVLEPRRAKLLGSSKASALFVVDQRSPVFENSRAPERVFKEVFYH